MVAYRDAFPKDASQALGKVARAAFSKYSSPGSIIFGEGEGLGFENSGQVQWLGPQWMNAVQSQLDQAAEVVNDTADRLDVAQDRLEKAEQRIITGGGALDQLDEYAAEQQKKMDEAVALLEGKITSSATGVREDLTRDLAGVQDALTQSMAATVADQLGQLSIQELQGLQTLIDEIKAQVATGQISGDQVTVNAAMATAVARAMPQAAKNLIVTGQALINRLDVLGPAMVDDLNVRGGIIGRDAILTGTVDIAQLNVTDAMTAALVQAMSVETKKLVVTEDTILNNATVIGRITTPLITAQIAEVNKLIANKADISQLTAGNITLSGRFQSGETGKPSIIIPSARRLTDGRTQVAVWFSHNGRDTTLRDGAPTAGLWMDTSSLDTATPLHLRGRMGGGIKSYGNIAVVDQYGGGAGRINGSKTLTLASGANGKDDWLALRANSIRLLPYVGDAAYSRSWASGGLRPVQIGAESGTLYTETSSRRVKRDIETTGPDHKWLDIRTVTYRAKLAVEVGEQVDAATAEDPDYEPTAEQKDVLHFRDTRFTGRIAEEMHEAGYTDQVIYDSQGRPDGIDYVRDGVKLIPHVREHRDQIRELQAENAELRARLEALETKLAQL